MSERPWSEGRCREEGHRLARMAADMLPVKTQRKLPDAPGMVNGRAVFYGQAGGDTVASTVQTHTGGATPWSEHPAFRQPDCYVWIKHDWHGYIFFQVSYTDAQGETVTKSHIPGDARSRAELRPYLESRRKRKQEIAEHGYQVKGPDTRKVAIRDWARQPIESTQLEPGKTVRCHSYKQFEKEVERRNLEIYKIQ